MADDNEANLIKNADTLIAVVSNLGADYMPPNPIAKVGSLIAKRDLVANLRTAYLDKVTVLETTENRRETIYAPTASIGSSIVAYVKSAGKSAQDVESLARIVRELRGVPAKALPKDDPATPDVNEREANRISPAQTTYASIADNFERLIEQYEALGIKPDEEKYKVATLRAHLAEMRETSQAEITATIEAATTRAALDDAAYLDEDSLVKSCVSGKEYLKSKYTTKGAPYKAVAGLRFQKPRRMRG